MGRGRGRKERGEEEGTRISNSRGKRNNTEDKKWHHRGRGRDKKEELEKGNRGEGKIMFVSRVEEEREPAVRSSSEMTGQQQQQEQE